MDLFRKLNLKTGTPVVLVNLPPSLEGLAAEGAFGPDAQSGSFGQAPGTEPGGPSVAQAVVFVRSPEEVAKGLGTLSAGLTDDPVLWFSYPKRGSAVSATVSRDEGWEALGQAGFQPVRQVAVNGDWSALRFRDRRFVGR